MSGDGGKKILFSCTGCKSSYSLARAEVDRLPGSVAVCTTCGKNIKIAFCPACGISYSITYSVPMRSRYTLTCRRCAEPFAIEFPSIREPVRIQALPPVPAHSETAPARRPALTEGPAHQETRDDIVIEERGKKPRKDREDDIILALPDRSFLQGALSFLAGVFNIRRLAFAAVAVAALFALLAVTDRAEAALQGIALVKGSAFLLHLLNFFSIFVICFILTLANSVTARFCMAEIDPSIDTGTPATLAFAASRALPVLAGNVAILIAVNALLVVFGAIPLVGPILYAVLFLPVYVLSVATVILGAVAIWFYPPVLARHGGIAGSLREFSAFTRRHNLALAVAVPVLVIITAVFTALLNLVHQGAMSLIIQTSRGILGDGAGRIFSAVPVGLERAVNFPQMLANLRSLGSFLGDLLLGYRAGGAILGFTLGVISVALLSIIFSFTGSLAARAYLLLENRKRMDGRRTVELLVVIFLVLAVLYLFKKVFL
ncbi:MAG TPA: hypothetical protein PKY31_00330 [Spirochaetota bacterium]|nr:hypothetical protein [Spirochaetota bacterium]